MRHVPITSSQFLLRYGNIKQIEDSERPGKCFLIINHFISANYLPFLRIPRTFLLEFENKSSYERDS